MTIALYNNHIYAIYKEFQIITDIPVSNVHSHVFPVKNIKSPNRKQNKTKDYIGSGRTNTLFKVVMLMQL